MLFYGCAVYGCSSDAATIRILLVFSSSYSFLFTSIFLSECSCSLHDGYTDCPYTHTWTCHNACISVDSAIESSVDAGVCCIPIVHPSGPPELGERRGGTAFPRVPHQFDHWYPGMRNLQNSFIRRQLKASHSPTVNCTAKLIAVT